MDRELIESIEASYYSDDSFDASQHELGVSKVVLPKNKYCLFPVTPQGKVGFVGRKIFLVTNGRLIVELFLYFIRNTVFLIQNVIKRFRVLAKKWGR